MDYMNPNEHWLNPELMKGMKPEEAQKLGCCTAIGYIAAIFVGLLICALLGSCRSHKDVVNETRDSVRVEVKEKIVYVPDTTYITIPAQSAEVTVKDSTSHLENEYAESDARINPDGTLFHSLATKPQEKPVEFQKPIVSKDSIRVETKWRTRTITKEVERKKTWWEQTKSYGFYVLVLLTLFRYRKKIWKVLMAIKV